MTTIAAHPESDTAAPASVAAPTERTVSWPLPQRLAWVRRFRLEIAQRRHELCRLAAEEVGKTEWEAFTGDVMPLLAACRWHERRARGLLGPLKTPGKAWWQLGQRSTIERTPIGRIALIATWNYPVQLLGIQLVQALVAGSSDRSNRVTVKPSERCPKTQALLLDLAERSRPAPGALTVAPATREAGAELIDSGRFDHVVFTGSTDVGRRIAESLAPTLTTSTLELSGRDSAFVLEGADPRIAARSIWYAVTLNAGQTCMAPKRALVDHRIYGPFLRELGRAVAGAQPVRLIDEHAAEVMHRQAEAAIAAGARSLTGHLEPPVGSTVRPVALTDCTRSMDAVAGRNFAPLLAIVPVTDTAEALAIHNDCDQHLATSIYGSPAAAELLCAQLASGIVTINDTVLPAAHPGGAVTGTGASGWGPSQGKEGLLAMTRLSQRSRTSTLIRTPLDPPAPHLQRSMTGFVSRRYGGR